MTLPVLPDLPDLPDLPCPPCPAGAVPGLVLAPGGRRGVRHVRVAVVGAGFAGIGTALRLADAGEDSVVVLERAHAVGGTWRDNVYPGIACDVPAHLYALSFVPNPWFSRRFAPGAEIRAYLERAADPVRDRIRLGTALVGARWAGDRWVLTTRRTPPAGVDGPGTAPVAEMLTADVLVLAAGRLTRPRVPDVPGTFEGPVVHTSRWDPDLDLAGRRVAVVGTGASGVQVVPHLADAASSLVVLQSTPSYVLPRGDVVVPPARRAALAADPALLAAERERLYAESEALYDARVGDDEQRARTRATALAHLARQVPDPVLRGRLTPRYEVGCKRVLFSDDYYPALVRPHVRVAGPLVAFEPGAVVAADGRHEVDVVVLATGFHAADQPYAHLVRGRTGATLAQHWAEGMRAYASTTVAGFPNLFVLDGPNASLSHNSSVVMIEAQIGYLLAALDHLPPGVTMEPLPAAEDAYVEEMARRSAGRAWTSGCPTWYVDPRSGRQVLLFPGTATEFRERLASVDLAAYARRGPGGGAPGPGA